MSLESLLIVQTTTTKKRLRLARRAFFRHIRQARLASFAHKSLLPSPASERSASPPPPNHTPPTPPPNLDAGTQLRLRDGAMELVLLHSKNFSVRAGKTFLARCALAALLLLESHAPSAGALQLACRLPLVVEACLRTFCDGAYFGPLLALSERVDVALWALGRSARDEMSESETALMHDARRAAKADRAEVEEELAAAVELLRHATPGFLVETLLIPVKTAHLLFGGRLPQTFKKK